jgi:hypothetical protein
MLSQSRKTRRQFLQAAAAGCVLPVFLPLRSSRADNAAELPPIRQLTRGPKFHWFGYYDKFEFDPTDRYVLGMEVDFEGRSPRADDIIRLGMVDLQDHDRWIELDISNAWCWQQGCMLQWLPGQRDKIIWNDRHKSRYVSHILDVKLMHKRTIKYPIYSVSPDGRWAVAPDFRRLADVRPGYGYVGIPDPNRDVLAPADSGVFRVDLENGEQKLLFSIADIARLPYPHADISQHKHWFNHPLINPDGSRFAFLHRFKRPEDKWLQTRMLTANADGSDVRVLVDSGNVSHFIWRDPKHILAYCKPTPKDKAGFFLFPDGEKPDFRQIAAEATTGDGHCSFSPDKRWILCDTYPDQSMDQRIFLYDVERKKRVELGVFRQPPEYRHTPATVEWRCDLHPRFSRDGRWVAFDSPHSGQGRQLHLIDVSKIVG